jgi:hypothetical protein
MSSGATPIPVSLMEIASAVSRGSRVSAAAVAVSSATD